MTQQQFLELIIAVCKRPQMYTPTGSFYEAASFLEGLGAGAGIEGDSHHSKFVPFRKWMAGRLLHDDRFPITWKQLAEQFSTEEEALTALPTLYQDFLGNVVQHK